MTAIELHFERVSIICIYCILFSTHLISNAEHNSDDRSFSENAIKKPI